MQDYKATIKKNRSNGRIIGKTSTFMSINVEKGIIETHYDELKDLIFPQIDEVENEE